MNEHAVTGSVDILLSQGVYGVSILVLLAAIFVLWKDNKALRAENSALQEKRVSETAETRTALITTGNILDKAVEVFKQGLKQ